MKGEKEAPPPEEGDEKPSEAAAEASGKEGEGAEEVPAGIPEFWLNVLRNYEEIGNRVSDLGFAGSRSIMPARSKCGSCFTAYLKDLLKIANSADIVAEHP